jgi:hypothetical protein
MKKYRSFPFTAPEQAWVTGGKTKLTFTGFVETTGESSRRTIIDGFEIFCRVNLSVLDNSESGVALAGADLYRMFGSITVEQKDGVKRYDEITGDALRIMNYAVLGWSRTREHPDVPITDGGLADVPVTVLVSAYVPLRKEFISHANDTAMPADVFNFIRIKMAENSDFPGSEDVVIHNAQYWVSADCHVEAEAMTYAVDTITMTDFETTSAVAAQTKMNMTGRPHDLIAYVPGYKGGLALTGLTEVLVVDVYQQSQLVAPDLVTRYARERDVVQGLAGSQGAPWRSDPFVPEVATPDVPRALALLLSTGNHPDEGPIRDNLTIKVRSTSSPGTLRLIARVLQQRSDKLDAAQAKKFSATGVTPDASGTIAATGNKSKTIAPRDAKFFPAKLTR